MSMSIFSSFDALCAEKLGFSWSPSPLSRQAAAVKIDDDLKKSKGEDVNSSSKPAKDRRTKKALRFAPEFDGVHCFETILPYWFIRFWLNFSLQFEAIYDSYLCIQRNQYNRTILCCWMLIHVLYIHSFAAGMYLVVYGYLLIGTFLVTLIYTSINES